MDRIKLQMFMTRLNGYFKFYYHDNAHKNITKRLIFKSMMNMRAMYDELLPTCTEQDKQIMYTFAFVSRPLCNKLLWHKLHSHLFGEFEETEYPMAFYAQKRGSFYQQFWAEYMELVYEQHKYSDRAHYAMMQAILGNYFAHKKQQSTLSEDELKANMRARCFALTREASWMRGYVMSTVLEPAIKKEETA